MEVTWCQPDAEIMVGCRWNCDAVGWRVQLNDMCYCGSPMGNHTWDDGHNPVWAGPDQDDQVFDQWCPTHGYGTYEFADPYTWSRRWYRVIMDHDPGDEHHG